RHPPPLATYRPKCGRPRCHSGRLHCLRGAPTHPLAVRTACRYAVLRSKNAPSKSGGSMRQRQLELVYRLAIILLAAAALPSPLAAQAPAVTVFEGARLITGDGGTPIDDSAFVVEGNRITQVGRKGAVTVPAGARRVDLTGKTVMPGIVDA